MRHGLRKRVRAVRLDRFAIAAVVLSIAGVILSSARGEPEASAKGLALFTTDVRPVLIQHCVKCHGGEKTKGEFDLTTRQGLLHPNDEGSNVIPGNAAGSRLMKLIRHEDDPTMPAKAEKLADAQIAKIAEWIDAGAPYDKPLIVKPGDKRNRAVVSDEDRRFWSFQPLRSPQTPEVKNQAWCRTPLDRFILTKLDEDKIAPNAAADRRKLIRRAYLDLIGLPPAAEVVESFVNDPDPHAWERVVDRLLASPEYGERWARHWLDLARFAESHGYEHDYDRPNAYHYRDFVIRALNSDMPYDRFVRLQIAGDELEPQNPEALLATGYLAAGTHSTQITVATAEKERYDELDDMASTVGTSLLGLTVGCARCHDHKYDPIPTRDYYRLISTFTTTVRSVQDIDINPSENAQRRREFESQHGDIKTAVKHLEESPLPRTARAMLNAAVALHLKTGPQLRTFKALVCSEGVTPLRLHTALPDIPDFYTSTYFLKRGDVSQKDGVADAGPLTVLTRAPDAQKRWKVAPPASSKLSYRRTALANWITDVDAGAGNLLARVIVNRLWQHHMGRGIVETPNDFGAQGARPTHPELLDFLASQLVASKWQLKTIHKLIMTSSVYMQSTAWDEQRAKVDRENKLYWRRPVLRLEGEAIRDSMLAVSGQLDPTMFGPGTLDESMRRRSIYFFVKRSKLIPMMMLFDWPDSLQGLGQRSSTTVAPQALALMNHPQIQAYAQAFARQLLPVAKESLERAVDKAYLTALARHPDPTELGDALDYLRDQSDLESALTRYCQTIFALNEFIYVE